MKKLSEIFYERLKGDIFRIPYHLERPTYKIIGPINTDGFGRPGVKVQYLSDGKGFKRGDSGWSAIIDIMKDELVEIDPAQQVCRPEPRKNVIGISGYGTEIAV